MGRLTSLLAQFPFPSARSEPPHRARYGSLLCGPHTPATLRPRLVPPFASDLWAQPVGLIPSQVRSSTESPTASPEILLLVTMLGLRYRV